MENPVVSGHLQQAHHYCASSERDPCQAVLYRQCPRRPTSELSSFISHEGSLQCFLKSIRLRCLRPSPTGAVSGCVPREGPLPRLPTIGTPMQPLTNLYRCTQLVNLTEGAAATPLTSATPTPSYHRTQLVHPLGRPLPHLPYNGMPPALQPYTTGAPLRCISREGPLTRLPSSATSAQPPAIS